MLLSSRGPSSILHMAQAVAETLPTVDMVKKAMLSIGGDGDAECRGITTNHRLESPCR